MSYKGIDACDGCGTPLGPDELLAGLCPECWATLEGIGGPGQSQEPTR